MSDARGLPAAASLCLGVLCLGALGCSDAALILVEHEQTAAADQAIVGGYVDDHTRGAVGLAINVIDLYFFPHCSGSLLSQNVVLTATPRGSSAAL